MSDFERETRPNLALKQMREASGKSQGRLAKDLNVSVAYLQAVEQGTRKANLEFAVRAMGHYGVWYQCVLEHWDKAVDLNGQPYIGTTYVDFCADRNEPLTDSDLEVFLEPLKKMYRGAAKIGKKRLLALWMHLTLPRALGDIRNLAWGMQEAIPSTQITVGQFRANKQLAEALDYTDDPSRSNEEIAWIGKAAPSAMFGLKYPDFRDINHNAIGRQHFDE